jgi:hypothetical protein
MTSPFCSPIDCGINVTLSAQLLPGAIGDATTQCWVVANGPFVPTLLTCNGLAPVLVRVTVLGLLVVPMA